MTTTTCQWDLFREKAQKLPACEKESKRCSGLRLESPFYNANGSEGNRKPVKGRQMRRGGLNRWCSTRGKVNHPSVRRSLTGVVWPERLSVHPPVSSLTGVGPREVYPSDCPSQLDKWCSTRRKVRLSVLLGPKSKNHHIMDMAFKKLYQ